MYTIESLLAPFLSEADLDKLAKNRQLRHRFGRERQASTNARIEALENDLGRVALLVRALADLCLSKGLMTRDELVRQLLEADLADGKRDQRLQAKVVMPGETKPSDPDPARYPAKKATRKRRKSYP